MHKAEVVTLCGSVRFAAEHLSAHRRLSLEGRVVLLPALPLSDDESLTADVDALAALHRRKIDMSDEVVPVFVELEVAVPRLMPASR